MALYYFHLRDGVERLLDPLGQEIADPETIPAIALAEARALIAADAQAGQIDLNQRIEVVDEGGELVHRIEFTDAVSIIGAGQTSQDIIARLA